MNKLVLIVIIPLMSACVGTFTGDPGSSEQIPAPQKNIVVTEILPANAENLGPISAISCKNKIYDPEASQENALAILKLKASQMGSDGIAAVAYDGTVLNLPRNCWASVSASGVAFKFK